jgi:hypothetical protein
MRLLQPAEVKFGIATFIAAVALIVNIVSALLLFGPGPNQRRSMGMIHTLICINPARPALSFGEFEVVFYPLLAGQIKLANHLRISATMGQHH